MKINFLLPPPGLSGGIRVVADYAEQLQRRGHTVVLLSMPLWQERNAVKRSVKSLLPGYDRSAAARWPSHLDGRSLDYRAITAPWPVLDRDLPDADVVVATWWSTAECVARLSPCKGAKAYFLQQFEVNFDQPQDRVEATWRLPMHKIVCARWLADLARDRFGDPHASVVPNGIDTDLFDAPPRGKQPRPTVGVMYAAEPPKAWGWPWRP